MRRVGVLAPWTGLLSLELVVALTTYRGYGTWWHYLVHQMIGWGVGLSTAALVAALTRYRVRAVLALVGGQLLSIVPDLLFRFGRTPHENSMDLWLGHISIHTGPPVLVALGSLLLGGWVYVGVTGDRPRVGGALAAGGSSSSCSPALVARDVPTSLSDYPLDTARVVAAR